MISESRPEEFAANRCDCGCCQVPDYGACDTFERGGNGRCAYCDHGQSCHPGKGRYFNLPLGVGERNGLAGIGRN
jgi:hypothetical protein